VVAAAAAAAYSAGIDRSVVEGAAAAALEAGNHFVTESHSVSEVERIRLVAENRFAAAALAVYSTDFDCSAAALGAGSRPAAENRSAAVVEQAAAENRSAVVEEVAVGSQPVAVVGQAVVGNQLVAVAFVAQKTDLLPAAKKARVEIHPPLQEGNPPLGN